MRHIRKRLSFANVVSVLALFVAMGGTAVAVDGSLPGQNTVGTDDIINQEVKSADIKDGAVTFFDIGANQVFTHQVKDGTLGAADLGTNSVGWDELQGNSVNSVQIQDGSVERVDLSAGALGARAFGRLGGGQLTRSKNIDSWSHPGPDGLFCIDPAAGINPSNSVMVVSEDYTGNSTNSEDVPGQDNISHVEWDSGAGACPSGNFEVRTFKELGHDYLNNGELQTEDQPFSFVIP